MRQHTPGPWVSSGVGVVQAETGELICAAIFEDGSEYPNAENNMNFIKSAPDLLAACKRVISDINEIGEVDDGTVKCVEEAIAEAVRE